VIATAGVWELTWSTPIVEADLWRYVLQNYGVAHWFMSPISGIANKYVEERPGLPDVLNELRGELSVVFVDECGETRLPDFEHPRDALYVFGKANYSPALGLRENGEPVVAIPSFTVGKNNGLLWPHQAAAIVLYDRLVVKA
jgi:hypothetical protein